jgi:hypothetical protein
LGDTSGNFVLKAKRKPELFGHKEKEMLVKMYVKVF